MANEAAKMMNVSMIPFSRFHPAETQVRHFDNGENSPAALPPMCGRTRMRRGFAGLRSGVRRK